MNWTQLNDRKCINYQPKIFQVFWFQHIMLLFSLHLWTNLLRRFLLKLHYTANAKWASRGADSPTQCSQWSEQWVVMCGYLHTGYRCGSFHQSHWQVQTSGTAGSKCSGALGLWLHVESTAWSGWKINTCAKSWWYFSCHFRANNDFFVPFIL